MGPLAMRYNWNWAILVTEPYLMWMLSGLLWTILVSLAGWVLALLLGSIVGVARTVRQPVVRAIAAAYVEVFRNIPLLVQLFLWYFVLPELLPPAAGTWLKRDLPYAEFWTAVVSLGTYTACRIAEQLRAGIEAIAGGQARAGLATGLTTAQVYRYILLPVAYRIIVPALTSEFLNIFKNSSLALTIGLLELTSRSRQISEYTYQPIEMFTAATLLYCLIALIVAAGMRIVEKRSALPGMITVEAR
ncbi:MAG TPA: amino acid ABC transporter permease [Stellaceae bacterium]|nr:amino acid ABC transporter permease [Stellaceae bacterium]